MCVFEHGHEFARVLPMRKKMQLEIETGNCSIWRDNRSAKDTIRIIQPEMTFEHSV